MRGGMAALVETSRWKTDLVGAFHTDLTPSLHSRRIELLCSAPFLAMFF